MKQLNEYISESIFDIDDETIVQKSAYTPKSKQELVELIAKTIIEERQNNKVGYKDIIDLNFIDTSNITDMSSLFMLIKDGHKYNYDVSEWDVSNVTNFFQTFRGCYYFDCDLSKWKINSKGKVIFNHTFHDCMNFEGKGLKHWDMSHVEATQSMFYNCYKFDEDISGWNVKSLRNAGSMFWGCTCFKQNLSRWDFSNVYCAKAFAGRCYIQNNRSKQPKR